VYLSTVKRLDDDFYSKYHQWVNSEQGKSALLHWLKTRKISETFNPKGVAPQWNSLKEMSIAGEKSLHQELRSRYDQMLAPFEDDRKIIATTWLYEWCKRNKIKVPRMNDLANFLEKIGGINKGQVVIEYESKYYKPTLWVIRHHETLKNADNKEIAIQFLKKYREDKNVFYIHIFNEAVINAF
jgi:transposase